MARVQYIEKDVAPPEVLRIYEEVERGFGLTEIHNSIKVAAHTPELMPHLYGFIQQILLGPGRIGARLREFVSLRVPSVNRCRY